MQIAVRFYDNTFGALIVPLDVKRSALTKEDLKLLNENGYDAAERKRIDIKTFLVTNVPECVKTNLKHIVGKRLFLYWNGYEKCWKHLDPDGDMLKANAKLYKTVGNVSTKKSDECDRLLAVSELLNGCEHPESISEKNKKDGFWDWVKRVHGIDMLAISREYADYLNS
jgi:hypothetical protein